MKIVIFGLTISSTWGNGHATLWRGLCSALIRRGHNVVFFEHDVPYYAENRDMNELPGGTLMLYGDWLEAIDEAERQLADADAGLVTSYCPHGVAATEALLNSRASCKAFYDLDTPITLARLGSGEAPPWIAPQGLRDFDVVFSFTGGRALEGLRTRLGARQVIPLYGSVDPDVHRPVQPASRYRADLSYLGTYAGDRAGGAVCRSCASPTGQALRHRRRAVPA
jgi:spore maturation protein CgeB